MSSPCRFVVNLAVRSGNAHQARKVPPQHLRVREIRQAQPLDVAVLPLAPVQAAVEVGDAVRVLRPGNQHLAAPPRQICHFQFLFNEF